MSLEDEKAKELAALNLKLVRNGRLTFADRLRRQGLIFNHSGKPDPKGKRK